MRKLGMAMEYIKDGPATECSMLTSNAALKMASHDLTGSK